MNDKLEKKARLYAILDFVCALVYVLLLAAFLFGLNIIIPNGGPEESEEVIGFILLIILIMPLFLMFVIAGNAALVIINVVSGIHWIKYPFEWSKGLLAVGKFFIILAMIVIFVGYLGFFGIVSTAAKSIVDYIPFSIVVLLTIANIVFEIILTIKHTSLRNEAKRFNLL